MLSFPQAIGLGYRFNMDAIIFIEQKLPQSFFYIILLSWIDQLVCFWQKTYWQGIGWHFIKYHWELYLVYEQWESIRHVNNITTMQFFWNSQPHSVKSWPYHRLILLSHGNLMHYGNVINMLYCASAWLESEMSTLDLSNVKKHGDSESEIFFLISLPGAEIFMCSYIRSLLKAK